jgi:hypothetical protein
MKVSNNAKHGTDKKANKFWNDIHLHYNELIGTPNKINEANIKYTQMEHRDAESLCNCWQRRLAPAIQKFARIVSRNKPLSGKVAGDNLMNLYCQGMWEIYASKSHTYKKDVPEEFSMCMKAYNFLSSHPKFEVKIPTNGSRLPSKNPSNLIASVPPDQNLDHLNKTTLNEYFVIHPAVKKTRPVGRGAAKQSDAVTYAIDKVTQKAKKSME